MSNILDIYKSTKKRTNPTDPKTIFIDPYNIGEYVGVRAKPSPVGFAVLRSMAVRCKPVAAIIHTRQNQVARYAKRPTYEGDTGFKITLKNPDAKPTDADKKEARRIEEALLNTGFIPNLKRKDNFDAFLRKIVRDSLVLDACTYEIVPDRRGRVVEWWAVDGGTIELVSDMAIPNKETAVYQPITPKGKAVPGEIAYVQRVFGEVVAEYTEEELAYGVRNPRTDINYALFGLSELEELIDIVTHILNATNYNGSYFTQSNLPQGVLEIIGRYDDDDLDSFRRAWHNLTSGTVGKWKVPIMALQEGSGLKFTPFKQSSRDMEYHLWLDFLNTVACAVYQIDPMEIGFRAWQPSGNRGMYNSTAEKTRSENSQSKGFYPLMQFLAGNFNSELINHINPEFKFEWVGLNEDDRVKKEEMRNQRITNGFTVIAEERAGEDKRSIVDMYIQDLGMEKEEAQKLAIWAYAPANPQLAAVFNQFLQGQQQIQAGEMTEKQLALKHTQALERAGYSHQQALAMGEAQAKQEMAKMEKQHGFTLEQGTFNENFQLEQSKRAQDFQAKQSETSYQRQLEQSAQSQNFQLEQSKRAQDFQMKQGDISYQRQLEQSAQSQNFQLEQSKRAQDFQAKQSETSYQRQLEQSQLGREQEPKQKLKKSLDMEEDVIVIELEL